MTSRKRKEALQLGMPMGTARNRLVRKLLFHLAEKLGMNKCFVCKEEMTEEDYSIEHKLPWLNKDTQLYWDLNNIAFSHKKCNRPHISLRTEYCTKGHKKAILLNNKSICRTCDRDRWHRRKYEQRPGMTRT